MYFTVEQLKNLKENYRDMLLEHIEDVCDCSPLQSPCDAHKLAYTFIDWMPRVIDNMDVEREVRETVGNN